MRAIITAAIISGLSNVAAAQDPVQPRPRNLAKWEWQPGVTSASLALDGFEPISSAGLSWPDGRQAVMIVWRMGDKVRTCVLSYDASMVETGDACKAPVAPASE